MTKTKYFSKTFALLLSVFMFIVYCMPNVKPVKTEAAELTVAQIKSQITSTYQTCLKRSKRSSYNGWCGGYVTQQLIVLGITKSGELSGDGNAWWKNMSKISKTSQGYTLTKYSGKECLNNIVSASGGKNVYNIVVAFSKGHGDAGATYGHVLFIHAIINGTVYFSDSFDWSTSEKEGSVLAWSVSKFYSKYGSSLGYVYDGAVVFSKEEPKPVISKIEIASNPVTTVYPLNSKLNTTGLSIKATYSDKSTKTLTSGFTVGTVDMSTTGSKTVSISYDGKSTSYKITVESVFSGSGTESDPFLISTPSDLHTLADKVNTTSSSLSYAYAYYKQINDIDMTGEDWIPIGIFFESLTSDTLSNYNRFCGTYDGNYFKIANLNVEYNKAYCGLFGRLHRSAVVKNVSLYGDINSTSYCCGGIAGEMGYGSKIINCSFNGTVSGNNYVGGIVGSDAAGGSIDGCYANAVLTASDAAGVAGGIIGYANVGYNTSSTDFALSNSYFIGTINSVQQGAIIGMERIQTVKECAITFSNNYYLSGSSAYASGSETVDGFTALESPDLKNAAELLGTPFAKNYNNSINNGYLVFTWQLKNIDLNNDGKLNITDLLVMEQYLMGKVSFSADQAQIADMDGDGSVTTFDLISLRQYILIS